MTTVGIKNLKARLSRYVGRAASGEQVVVTERGKPVALLGPIPAEWRAMKELHRKGILRGGPGDPKDLLGIAVRLKKGQPDPNVSGAVMEDRDESERRL